MEEQYKCHTTQVDVFIFSLYYICVLMLFCVYAVSHLEYMQSETAAGVYQAANMQYFRGEKWCFWLSFGCENENTYPVSERRFYE
jgi:hypothetical protein